MRDTFVEVENGRFDSAPDRRWKHLTRLATLIAICLALCLGTGCLRTRVQANSPNGKRAITLQESCGPADCYVRVRASESAKENVLASKIDCSPTLAHIVWSSDSARAGVLVSDGYCGNLYLTYDFTTSTILPGSVMEEQHAAGLVRQYGAPTGLSEHNPEAIVQWALDSSIDGERKHAIYARQYPRRP